MGRRVHGSARVPIGARLFRALIVLATSTLVVCGVKGPPRPPAAEPEAAAGGGGDAGPPDGGAR